MTLIITLQGSWLWLLPTLTGHVTNSKRYTISIVEDFGKLSLAYISCTVFNSLLQHIRESRTTSLVNSRTKEHLLISV